MIFYLFALAIFSCSLGALDPSSSFYSTYPGEFNHKFKECVEFGECISASEREIEDLGDGFTLQKLGEIKDRESALGQIKDKFSQQTFYKLSNSKGRFIIFTKHEHTKAWLKEFGRYTYIVRECPLFNWQPQSVIQQARQRKLAIDDDFEDRINDTSELLKRLEQKAKADNAIEVLIYSHHMETDLFFLKVMNYKARKPLKKGNFHERNWYNVFAKTIDEENYGDFSTQSDPIPVQKWQLEVLAQEKQKASQKKKLQKKLEKLRRKKKKKNQIRKKKTK